MKIDPEIAGVSVVFVGHFNPAIFTPAWFGWRGLLSKRLVESTGKNVAALPQIAAFNAEWLSLEVLQRSFKISTTQSPVVRLRDLAVRIFREHLPHTPLEAMGINREVHFSMGSFTERDRIGRLLAPVEPWGDWGKKLQFDGERGGMTSLTMTQVNPEGRPPGGQVNVTVEPSKQIGRRGVYVRINDHYTIQSQGSQMATSEIISFLERDFEKSLRRSDQIINHIMSLKGK